MSSQQKNIEFEDIQIGQGALATREHKAIVSGTISLHRGEQVQQLERYEVDLKRRSTIAGLRYGIEGMRVGGIRRITIPPHLAYGEKGWPYVKIPPNALLICEVTLLELRPTHPIPPRLKAAREQKSK